MSRRREQITRALRTARIPLLVAAVVSVALAVAATAGAHHGESKKAGGQDSGGGFDRAATFKTSTPIKHIVVIFQENVSFDHYFATYPHAVNSSGEPAFHALPGTPTVNGLQNPALMNDNPNSANPFRFDRSHNYTCDQDHDYGAEQAAFDGGLMDKFVENTGTTSGSDANGRPCHGSDVMGYFDGNTVTAMWNYAQNFAMDDNSYGTTFGPSTPGAINLVSGQTHGASTVGQPDSSAVANGTDFGDDDPAYDDCSGGNTKIAMSGRNIGNLLNSKGVTWGWFEGGFRPSASTAGKATCGTQTKNLAGQEQTAYSPHHEPFQYYQSTANPHHLPPSSAQMIGHTDQANHQYDLSDFWNAVDSGNMPAVSYLKAPRAQDGHAGYSSPLDEQRFVTTTINRLEQRPEWRNTAVVINWDDSDGWYDHQMGPIVQQSQDPANDKLDGAGLCGTKHPATYQDRCGYGPRLPLLVISPWAKRNFVDNTTTDQTSSLRFIEDNWGTGRIGDQSFDAKAGTLEHMLSFEGGRSGRTVFLDPSTGEVTGGDRSHGSQH